METSLQQRWSKVLKLSKLADIQSYAISDLHKEELEEALRDCSDDKVTEFLLKGHENQRINMKKYIIELVGYYRKVEVCGTNPTKIKRCNEQINKRINGICQALEKPNDEAQNDLTVTSIQMTSLGSIPQLYSKQQKKRLCGFLFCCKEDEY